MINLISHAAVYHYLEYIALAVIILMFVIIPKWDKNK